MYLRLSADKPDIRKVASQIIGQAVDHTGTPPFLVWRTKISHPTLRH
jgi:hypothetical protein